jgi:hypothetical protein
MSVDIVRENLSDKINELYKSQEEVNNEMVEFRNFVTNKMEENRQVIMEFEENAI